MYIDNVKVDSFSAQAGSLSWQQSCYTSPELSQGVHTVAFRNPGTAYMDIDALTIYAALSPGTYDDMHPGWAYAGVWSTYAASGPSAGTLHYTNTLNSSASFTFAGTQFQLVCTKHTNRGNVDVYIDNLKVDSFSAQAGSLKWQQACYTSPALSPGVHTVAFKNPATTVMDVDTITIFNWP